MSTLLAPPDPTTRRAIVRDAPYRGFVERAFGPNSTFAERSTYRWLYRAFRQQKHSTPFSARAQISTTLMRVDKIKDHAS